MIPFCVTTLVTHDIKLSQYFRKITEYKESNFLFSSEFKMYLYILIIGVLLNIWAESQTYAHCFFVDG